MKRGDITEHARHDGHAELYDAFGAKLFAYALSLVSDVFYPKKSSRSSIRSFVRVDVVKSFCVATTV